MNIDPVIQAWIDKDTLYLETCSTEDFQKYKAWFYNASTDIEPVWFEAIEKVIQNKENNN